MTALERARELARSLREGTQGVGETIQTFGTGILADVPAGLEGLRSLGEDIGQGRKPSTERAAKRVQALRERYTYQPKSDLGQRGVANVAKAVEKAGEEALKLPGAKSAQGAWVDFTAAHPALAATTLAAADVVGPGGKAKRAKAVAETAERAANLRRVTGTESPPLPSGQLELAGMGTTPQQRLEQATQNLARIEDKGPMMLSAEDAPRAVEFGTGPRSAPEPFGTLRTATEVEGAVDRPAIRAGGYGSSGNALRFEINERPDELDLIRENRYGLGSDLDRARERIAQLRGASEDVNVARATEARARRNLLTEESRALGTAPTDPLEFADYARERARIARSKPVISEDYRVFEPDLESSRAYTERGYQVTPYEIEQIDPSAYAQVQRAQELQQEAVNARRATRDITEFIESDPRRAHLQPFAEPDQPAWAQALTAPRITGEAPAGRDWWNQRLGIADYEQTPNLMNREAVDAFLTGAQENPALFMYGAAPPANVRSLEDMARHFGQQAGERIRVDWTEGESDEPYKIKVPKEHGRGELMRDRYGDYKMEEAGPGQIKYDEYGDPVMKEKEVELVGPPPEGEDVLMGTKEIKKKVPEGDYYRDESGEYVYRKSEGGEPVRDERGRQKYTEEENPDYSEGSEGYELSLPSGARMTAETGGSEEAWGATGVGKGKGGDLLYQTALASAVREGRDIGSFGLTSDNQLRLLSNTLSNYARMGENPRSVTGTLSGRAERARGRAEGPELWRAEAEEAKERMRDMNVKPERVRFDGENFTVDGKEVEADKILDAVGWQGGKKNVGQKTVMRMAFFDWLRGADPADAAKAAKGWKKHGPLFATVAGAAVGLGAVQGDKENAD